MNRKGDTTLKGQLKTLACLFLAPVFFAVMILIIGDIIVWLNKKLVLMRR